MKELDKIVLGKMFKTKGRKQQKKFAIFTLIREMN
jgi:hypothetical protein